MKYIYEKIYNTKCVLYVYSTKQKIIVRYSLRLPRAHTNKHIYVDENEEQPQQQNVDNDDKKRIETNQELSKESNTNLRRSILNTAKTLFNSIYSLFFSRSLWEYLNVVSLLI